jgi:hypothetical protein
MTKHEELYALYQKRDEAWDRLWDESSKTPVFFGFKRHLNKINELRDNSHRASRNFENLLYDVLLSKHGISRDSIVGEANSARFKVIINRRLREVTVKDVGQRFVFFIDGLALKENEKVSEKRLLLKRLGFFRG